MPTKPVEVKNDTPMMLHFGLLYRKVRDNTPLTDSDRELLMSILRLFSNLLNLRVPYSTACVALSKARKAARNTELTTRNANNPVSTSPAGRKSRAK